LKKVPLRKLRNSRNIKSTKSEDDIMSKNTILDGSISYLCGPIDEAYDDGKIWRRRIKEMLREKGIRVVLLDPTDKFENLTDEVGDEKKKLQELKAEENWAALRDQMKGIVRADLRMVDLCDFLIVKIDTSVHMCGTYHEMFVADIEKKPILMIIEGGKEKCPSWIFGIVHYKFMFDSVEDCVEYLEQVNKGEVILDDKWVLMRTGIRNLQKDVLTNER